MPFFQNPHSSDFTGSWVLGDRQYSPDFNCPRNAGRGPEFVTVWNEPPYDLSGNDADGNTTGTITFSFALNDTKNWADLTVTLTGATQSAVTGEEIMNSLQTDSLFPDYFEVSLEKFSDGNSRVIVHQLNPITKFRFYIKNGNGESVLGFNKRAGVAQLPTYFMRHTIDNRFVFPDSQGMLNYLDVSSNVAQALIDNAVDFRGNSLGFSHTSVSDDYVLLAGRSGIFNFQKITVDGSDRITQIIEYPAGAIVGGMARKITYSYTSTNTKPDQICEVPYTLADGDFVTP